MARAVSLARIGAGRRHGVQAQDFQNATMLVDGNLPIVTEPAFRLCNQVLATSGDARFLSLGVSSIVAKVIRDLHMIELNETFPDYFFAKNCLDQYFMYCIPPQSIFSLLPTHFLLFCISFGAKIRQKSNLLLSIIVSIKMLFDGPTTTTTRLKPSFLVQNNSCQKSPFLSLGLCVAKFSKFSLTVPLRFPTRAAREKLSELRNVLSLTTMDF